MTRSQRTSSRSRGASPREERGAGTAPGGPAAWGRPEILALAFLVVLTIGTLWPVLRSGFVLYDDDQYVTANDWVRRGLAWDGVRWALTASQAANWHPLTWISHMTDVSVFGLNPHGHHATNLLLHGVNVLLLFLLCRSLTREVWPSAWVAAAFAVHPAHVESVAWIAERKDVLSTAFGLATMIVYVSWTRRPGALRYAVMLLLFAAGLMSKPMLVSLPLLLLLLDFWPLERVGTAGTVAEGKEHPPRARSWTGLALEKVPLFLMAAASCLVTFLVQRAGGAVKSLETFPFGLRVENALVSYVRYLRMLVWPADLAVLYPHPQSLPIGEVVGCGLFLALLSAGIFALRRKAPSLLTGWLWFLVTLLPVIGLVQVGNQALADRYTYLPFIGLFLGLAWGARMLQGSRTGRFLVRAAALAAVAAWALLAAIQVRFWHDSGTLFVHTLRATGDNEFIAVNLAQYDIQQGKPKDAISVLDGVFRTHPDSQSALINAGQASFILGRLDVAAGYFSRCLRLNPSHPTGLNNLARIRLLQGRFGESTHLYRAAIAADPRAADFREFFAMALLVEEDPVGGEEQLARAAEIDPRSARYRDLRDQARAFRQDPRSPSSEGLRRDLALLHRNVAAGLRDRGQTAEAEQHLRRAIGLVPQFTLAHLDLGTLLAQQNRMDEAAAEFEETLRLNPGVALAHNNLGYLLLLRGQREAAIEHYREALRLDPSLTLARNNLEKALRAAPPEGRPTPSADAR